MCNSSLVYRLRILAASSVNSPWAQSSVQFRLHDNLLNLITHLITDIQLLYCKEQQPIKLTQVWSDEKYFNSIWFVYYFIQDIIGQDPSFCIHYSAHVEEIPKPKVFLHSCVWCMHDRCHMTVALQVPNNSCRKQKYAVYQWDAECNSLLSYNETGALQSSTTHSSMLPGLKNEGEGLRFLSITGEEKNCLLSSVFISCYCCLSISRSCLYDRTFHELSSDFWWFMNGYILR